MPHDGNACAQDSVYRFEDFLASLELDGACFGLLHDAYRRTERLFRVALIGAEGHVHYHEGTFHCTGDRLCMVYHVVERHGDGRFVAGHDVGSGIADQNDVYSGPVEDTGHGVVVCRQHGDFFAAAFHFGEPQRGDRPEVSFGGHRFLNEWITSAKIGDFFTRFHPQPFFRIYILRTGARVPLPGFGYNLVKGAVEGAEKGLFEAVTGGLKAAAGGITVAIGWGYLIAVIFNPKSVR